MQNLPLQSIPVAQRFDTTLASIRANVPDLEALEPEANEWLRIAGAKLFKDVEAAYHTLDRLRDSPMALPAWALDPKEYLLLSTDRLPALLEPYDTQMCDALAQMLRECGFVRCEVRSCRIVGRTMMVRVWFPARVLKSARDAGSGRGVGGGEGQGQGLLRFDAHGGAPVLRRVTAAGAGKGVGRARRGGDFGAWLFDDSPQQDILFIAAAVLLLGGVVVFVLRGCRV
ncbi:hypothetical protein DFH06DRAFT_1370503 [Mycena polygramma]|nr:hypothetical protein DFH06DRAFT_1370503 [Mycena polygramma]